MKLLKPTIAALVASGLIGITLVNTSFAAYGKKRMHHKRTTTYGYSKPKSCDSKVWDSSRGVGLAQHNTSCHYSRSSMHGLVDFGLYGHSVNDGTTTTTGQKVGLGNLLLGWESSVNKTIHVHFTAGLSNPFNMIVGTAVPRTFVVPEAYLVYQEDPIFVKGGQYFLPIGTHDPYSTLPTITQGYTTMNANAVSLGFHNEDMGVNGSLTAYSTQPVNETKSLIGFGFAANYGHTFSDVGVKVHVGLVSDPRQMFDNDAANPSANNDIRFASNAAAAPRDLKAALLFNVMGGVTYEGFHLNGEFTSMGNAANSGTEQKFNVIHADLGYDGKMNDMDMGVAVGYETVNTDGQTFLNRKDSMYGLVHASLLKNTVAGFKFAQFKDASDNNSSFYELTMKVNF